MFIRNIFICLSGFDFPCIQNQWISWLVFSAAHCNSLQYPSDLLCFVGLLHICAFLEYIFHYGDPNSSCKLSVHLLLMLYVYVNNPRRFCFHLFSSSPPVGRHTHSLLKIGFSQSLPILAEYFNLTLLASGSPRHIWFQNPSKYSPIDTYIVPWYGYAVCIIILLVLK